KAQKALADNLSPSVVPLTIDLDSELSNKLGLDRAADASDLIAVYVPQLRDALYLETGVRFPGVRVRTCVGGMPASSFCIRVNDVPAVLETFPHDKYMAIVAPEGLKRLGVNAPEGRHPVNGQPVAIITREQREVVETSGIKTWNISGVIALHLGAV